MSWPDNAGKCAPTQGETSMAPAQDATALADEPSRDELLALAGEQEGEAKAHLAMGDKFEARNSIIRAQSLRLRATSQTPDAVREALKHFGRHDDDCAVKKPPFKCSCGFHAALSSASAVPQAEGVAYRWRWLGEVSHNPWRLVESANALSSYTTEVEPLYAHPQPQMADVVAWLCEYDGHTDATTDPDTVRIWRDTLGRKITPLGPQQADGRGAVLGAVERAMRENPYTTYSFPAQNDAVERKRAEKYVRMIARVVASALQQSPATDNAPAVGAQERRTL